MAMKEENYEKTISELKSRVKILSSNLERSEIEKNAFSKENIELKKIINQNESVKLN